MAHEPRPLPDEPEYEPDDQEAAPRVPGRLIGQTLGNRYRFDELIGEGTFARVYRVYDLHRRANLAAKVLRSDIAHEPAFLERFRREASVLARLQHPNIVRYYDTVEIGDYVFILTDYIPGDTLQTELFRRGEPFTPQESLEYLTPLAAALHYAHQEGIVHRDLKPANILLDENGHLYVTDYGIARILSDTSTLTVDAAVGTPHYMSPEQILAGNITPATDIYALGVMLYQMVTGQLPFRGDSPDAQGTTNAVRVAFEHLHMKPTPPRNLNSSISPAVQDVILRCLEKDPSQRYTSVSDVYDALNAAIGSPSVSLDSAELRGVPFPEAERVPTGVGGISQVLPQEEAYWEPDKPKRQPQQKAKRREARAPVQGEKQQEKDRDNSEKQNEKDRDKEEKEREKGPEKANEKSEFFGDLAPTDRLGQFTGGAILLWVGVAYMLNSAGIFGSVWPWILSGAGALLLGEVGVRLAIPEYRAIPGARLMAGIVLLIIGLIMGLGASWGSMWPLILIGVGISILLNRLVNR